MTTQAAGPHRPDPIEFDPLDPVLANELWERSAAMLDTCPVGWSELYGGFWVLSRYDDVFNAGKAWQSYSNADGAAPVRFKTELFDMIPLETDPPFHHGLRTLLSPFFTAEAIKEQEGVVRQVTRDLLEPCLTGKPVDFEEMFTGILPANVIFRTHFKQDPAKIGGILPVLHRLFSEPQSAGEIVPELLAWCSSLLEDARGADDRDSMLGTIAHAQFAGEFPLTDKVRTEIVWQLVMAGLDTTTAGLANICLHLGRDPELRARLKSASREDVDRAVHEFLRFEAPVPSAGRTLTKDVELHGCPMNTGDYVLISWAAANRDPRFFTDPDLLDLDRHNAARHLSFGAGVHRCLGRHLASLELAVVIQEVSQLSTFEWQPDQVSYRGGFVRAPLSLIVTAQR